MNWKPYIGVLRHYYCSVITSENVGRCDKGNFGVGFHDDPSSLAVGESGTGDFNLRYRIASLSVTPAG